MESRASRYTQGALVAERYEIVRSLGSGSIGEVFHVLDRALDYQSLALKRLHPHLLSDESVLNRFQNEVLFARQLGHENIVRTFDLIVHEGVYFLSMEYIDGCDLDEIRNGYDRRRLPLREAIYLLLQIAEGLAHAHQKNIIHRDLKPQNILLSSQGGVKIADFGLARSLESHLGLTRTGEVIGSPAYLAPEQFRQSSASATADIYSLGVLGFELLCGHLPFACDSLVALAVAHQAQAFPSDELAERGVPRWLIDILERCCEKDPQHRFQSARAFIQAFQEVAEVHHENPQTLLRTLVRRKSQDRALLSERTRHFLTFLWAFIVVSVSMLSVFESGARKRLLAVLINLELQAGIETEAVQKLLLLGDSFDPHNPEDFMRAVHKSGNDEVIGLIDGGVKASLRFTDESRDTVLHRAIREGAPFVSAVIDRSFGQVNFRNRKGETPLLLALKLGDHISAFELVAANSNLSLADKSLNYPIHVAVATGQIELLSYMLGRPNNFYAMAHRIKQEQRSWFEDVYFRDDIRTATEETLSFDLIRSLRGGSGLGALHLAVLTERPQVLRLLLMHNFDVEHRDFEGKTALMHAVMNVPSDASRECVEELLAARASLTARDDQGQTAFEYARLSGYSEWLEMLEAEQQRRRWN